MSLLHSIVSGFTGTALLILALLLSACSLSGIGGSSSYACKAPPGVRCDSMTGTYYNALQNNLPSQQHSPKSGAVSSSNAPQPIELSRDADAKPLESNTALRASARIIRLWIKPWEDADRDLHDQSFIYVQIDSGRWRIDHIQRRSREGYAPVLPPRSPAARAPTTDSVAPTPFPALPPREPGPAGRPDTPPGGPVLPMENEELDIPNGE